MERPAKRLKRTHTYNRKRPSHNPSRNGSLWQLINLPVFVPFLRLPPEVRNLIYEHALRLDDGICELNEEENFPEPALLFTCKTIRTEAIGIFYSVNSFKATMTSYSPAMPIFLEQKDDILDKKYRCSIQNLAIRDLGPPRWANLLSWVKYVHENRKTGRTHKLPPTRIAIKALCNDMPTGHPGSVQEMSYKERRFINGLFVVTVGMWNLSWERVDMALSMLREGLIAFDREWRQD